MDLIVLENIEKTFEMGEQSLRALHKVNLRFQAGEFSAIVGPSGSGKSTLLNILGCVDRPSAGSYKLMGEDVLAKTDNELADLRGEHLGFIFQTFNLLPVLSAYENVEFPLLNRPGLKTSEIRERTDYYLDKVGLTRFKHHRPRQMSGGQRQRVAIARALATKPKVILADEPTASLDHKNGEAVLELMLSLNETEKVTFIFSTHDPRVMNLARRQIPISDGMLTSEI